ncbi:MAG TPA: hypothetical protein DCF42_01870 [Lachnospiraceae bacterium]|nr:hypothetical protein [Lachnospiraceae bacterium]
MLNRFGRHRRNGGFGDEDPNPMAGVSNLADAMLVLAVGIMLALVINWHISINGNAAEEMDKSQMKEVDSSTYENAEKKKDSTASLEKKGTVYVDPSTGKMYLVEEEDQ